MQHIRRASFLCLLFGALAAPRAAAQSTGASAPPAPDAPPADSVFRRARQLVGAGNGAAGRALVDSALAAAAPQSAQYAEALFWRASLAAASADAERDYRRLAVEFPLSPRSEDALLRLAQLELARGDRAMAVKHLERLTLEHPTGASRPRAAYWMARVLFEMNDVAGGCSAIAGARAYLSPDDIELRNQVEFTARRCSRFEAQRLADSVAAAAAGPGATASTATTAGTTTGAAPSTAAPAKQTVATTPAPAPASATPAPAKTPAPVPPSPATPPVASRTTWAVQVAAFDTRASAQDLVARLGRRGLTAHVSGSAAPFRVRIGRLASRAQAVQLQRELAEKKISGFVVSEETAR